MIRRLAACLLLLSTGLVYAQSGPHWPYGYLPGAGQIEAEWESKADVGLRSEASALGCATIVNTPADAAPCISATLADAASRNRVAHFTGGVYRVLSAVTMPLVAVTIEGDGWDQVGPTSNGTWFSIGWGGGSPFVSNSRTGPKFRHIGFAQDQPTPAVGWTPAAYPPVITLGQSATSTYSVDNAEFDDIMLFGVYGFVQVQGGQRLFAHHIYGEPFAYAFDTQASADVQHMSDFHFWPFWLFAPGVNASTAAANAVIAWQNANGVPIISRRNDNPVYTDMFAFGYHACFQFDSQTTGPVQGITSRFSITGGGCDASQIGILITGNGTSGQVANYYHDGANFGGTGGAPLTNSFGIYDPGTNALVDITNWRETNIDTSMAAIPNVGENSDFNLTNVRVELWSNVAGSNAPAFYAADTSTIKIGGQTTFGGTAGTNVIPGILQSANVTLPELQESVVTSSGATVAQMTLDGGPTYNWNGIDVPYSRACQVHALVTGRDIVSQDVASFVLDGLYLRGSTGMPTLIGFAATPTFHTSNATSWSAQMVANNAVPNVAINVSQASDTSTVYWQAHVTENCR